MGRTKKWLVGLGASALAMGTAFQFQRLTSEEPSYKVVKQVGQVEVRDYGPRVIARTPLVLGADGKDNTFRILAGYIFGGNTGGESISMTTPVTTDGAGAKISMTTPVETVQSESGMFMTFTMPREYSLKTLPMPNDRRIELLEVPSQRVATLRFSGRAQEKVVEEKKRELLRLVKEAGLSVKGTPALAQYDPPWVLGIFRRNEVSVAITKS